MEELIVKFLNNELSEIEKQQLGNWLKANPENKKQFNDFKLLWETSNKLSSIEEINVEDDWQSTKKRMNFENSAPSNSLTIKRNVKVFWKMAASIIILIGIGLLSKQFIFTSPEMICITTVEMQKEVTLPDGSLVVLNKNSELTYPEKFNKNQRLVSLSGEGYFEVIKNPDKQFRINIDEQAVIEVLGTSFNIYSEKENKLVDVNVLSGKVAFYSPEQENAKTILVKDENASFKNGVISKNLPKDKNFLSWRTGVIFFENESIENVCKTLSKFYDKKIIIEELDGNEILFTSTIDNQELGSVLEEIKLVLYLDYTISDDQITIHTPKTNQE